MSQTVLDAPSLAEPADQAAGLRRLFAADRLRFVPVVANPHGVSHGVLLERLATALAEAGAQVLVVDAAETSPAPLELAGLDLAACVEPLSARVSYLAARGLPLKHVDAQGSCATFLDLLAVAAPQAEVALLHASAQTLVRLFHGVVARPVLLAAVQGHSQTHSQGESQGESILHAYAAMKLLAQRCRWMQFDLFLAGDPWARASAHIAQRVADCAGHFVGANLHLWAAADPQGDVHEPITTPLQRLAGAQWHARTDLPPTLAQPGATRARTTPL